MMRCWSYCGDFFFGFSAESLQAFGAACIKDPNVNDQKRSPAEMRPSIILGGKKPRASGRTTAGTIQRSMDQACLR